MSEAPLLTLNPNTPYANQSACWHLKLIDSGIIQLKAQGPSRTCNESKKEDEEVAGLFCTLQVIPNFHRRASGGVLLSSDSEAG